VPAGHNLPLLSILFPGLMEYGEGGPGFFFDDKIQILFLAVPEEERP
jgi:hypothetical protein